MFRPVLFAALALVAVPIAAGFAHGADKPALWPQWRGPSRDSQIKGAAWPAKLDEKTLKQERRIDLGEGYPGPIVAADRVFVAETKGKSQEVVRAIDRKTGKQLWEHSWKGSLTVPFFAASNGSWIRSTPAYDGEFLYVGGMRDVLACLDARTGKEKWRVDLKERYSAPLPAFGFVCSPLVDESAVYVQAAASLLKLNKKTGKEVWRTLKDGGGMYGSAFSSPIFATIQGTKQLVVQSRTTLAGVDPDKGTVLWEQKIPATRGMNILTPTVRGNTVFISAYGAKTYLFTIDKDGDKFKVKTTWTLPFDANMSSPVVVGKHAYLHLKNQLITCIDLESGKTTWTTKRRFGKYMSMVANGDRILALDQRGSLLLIKANPKAFELLDERKVSKQDTWAHLAVCGDELFVRELKGLIKLRWK